MSLAPYANDHYLASADAAGQFGLSSDHVARLCRSGEVEGIFMGKKWLVHESSLRRYVERTRQELSHRHRELSETRKAELSAQLSRKGGGSSMPYGLVATGAIVAIFIVTLMYADTVRAVALRVPHGAEALVARVSSAFFAREEAVPSLSAIFSKFPSLSGFFDRKTATPEAQEPPLTLRRSISHEAPSTEAQGTTSTPPAHADDRTKSLAAGSLLEQTPPIAPLPSRTTPQPPSQERLGPTTVTESGVTRDLLDIRLNALSQKLSKETAHVEAVSSKALLQNTQSIALLQKVDSAMVSLVELLNARLAALEAASGTAAATSVSRGGVTLDDRATDKPFCLFIQNGTPTTTPGVCK